jgi:hypothetical protein
MTNKVFGGVFMFVLLLPDRPRYCNRKTVLLFRKAAMAARFCGCPQNGIACGNER